MGFTLITIIIRYWLNSIEILGTFFCHFVSVTSIKLYPIVAMLHIFRKKNIRRVDKDLYYVYVKCIAKLTMYFISSNVGAIFFFLKRFFFFAFQTFLNHHKSHGDDDEIEEDQLPELQEDDLFSTYESLKAHASISPSPPPLFWSDLSKDEKKVVSANKARSPMGG